MVLIWGSDLYGKVDEVPGVCWVATKFGHLYYIPLIPMGSYAVFEQDGDAWNGVEIGFDMKSILVAWFRAACVVFALVGIVMGLVALNGNSANLLIAGGIAGAGIGGYILSRLSGVTVAGYDRARALSHRAGLPEEMNILIDAQYGRISMQDAERTLMVMEEEAIQREEDQEARREARRLARRAERAERAPVGRVVNEDLRAKAPKRRRRARA